MSETPTWSLLNCSIQNQRRAFCNGKLNDNSVDLQNNTLAVTKQFPCRYLERNLISDLLTTDTKRAAWTRLIDDRRWLKDPPSPLTFLSQDAFHDPLLYLGPAEIRRLPSNVDWPMLPGIAVWRTQILIGRFHTGVAHLEMGRSTGNGSKEPLQ